MLRLTSYLILFVCIWSVEVLGYAQHTQEQSDYETIMVAALQEYHAGKYPEARALFQRAHQLQPCARTLRGLGLVEVKLNHHTEAVRLLRAAINDAHMALTPEVKLQTERQIQELGAHIGQYRIAMSPAGATLTVDGSPADEPPLLLNVGEHLLSVQSPGYQPQERRLNVRGGATEDLRFDLVLEPSAAPPVVATPAPVPEVASSAEPTDRPVAARENPDAPATLQLAVRPDAARDEQSPSARPTWGWLAIGTSALSLAGTVVAWRIGESAADRWNDDNRCLRNGDTREANCGADKDTANAARAWTTAGLIATGVFGAAATFLLWPRQHQAERAAARTQCVVMGIGLACAVRL